MTAARNRSPAREKGVSIDVTEQLCKVSGLLLLPNDARALLVFGHGAGAGMNHPFMTSVARKLAGRGVATLRYQFPYMESGGRRPDAKPRLLGTARAAIDAGARMADGLPLFLGGKSMGGRMGSTAIAERPDDRIRGLVFVGFPLHAPGNPSSERADHLFGITVPMLFLQGTRDTLADLNALKPVCRKLGKPAALHVIEGADHSFHVPRSLKRTDDDIHDELADIVVSWIVGISPA